MTDIIEQLDHLITIGVDNEGLVIIKASIAEVKRLHARIAELEAYVAFLEGGPMPKLATSQEQLGEPFSSILRQNLNELYVKT